MNTPFVLGRDVARGEAGRAGFARRGFTLVELLVVIGIIALLISILLPALSRANDSARAIKCAANLRQIGTSVVLYAQENKGKVFPHRNWGRWQDRTTPSQQIDPWYLDPASNDYEAYWGVSYAKYSNFPKKVFNCPEAAVVNADTSKSDGPFGQGGEYRCYGLNGYGMSIAGGDAMRSALFGAPDTTLLFHRVVDATGTHWMGNQLSRIRRTADCLLAWDAYEEVIDGNGDTFSQNMTQWTPPPIGTANADYTKEFLRHRKNTVANILWCDGHVSALDRTALADERIYAGFKE